MDIKQALNLLNVPAQWLKTKGAGVKVAVIDYPCIASRVPFVHAVNYDPAKDGHWHGSLVAWLVNQVAPEAEIYGLNMLSGGWSLAECLNWCIKNGIHIANMSVSALDTADNREAVKRARAADIILVACAGNSGYDADDSDSEVWFPACMDGVIAVANLQQGERIAGSSSGGPEVFTAAPGVIDGLPWSPWSASGTSFAAPLITGSLALVKAAYPWTTPAQAREFVKAGCRDILTPGRDDRSGFGVFRFPAEREIEKIEGGRKMKICIDPGHGGSDPGAVGPSGVRESHVVLAVSKKLADVLVAAGAEVKLTRDDDSDVSLDQRVKISDDFGADVFILIHANAFSSPAAKGMEVWTCKGQTAADPIAESIANSLQKTFPGLVFRADMSDGDQDKEENYFVLVNAIAPAVLVELAFITNPIEEELLSSADYQAKAARAIAEGIAAFTGLKLPAEQAGGEIDTPVWAKDALMWAVANGLVDTQEGSNDWYRFITVLHRYDKLRR